VLRGIATSGEPFFRTPKGGNAGSLWRALFAARDELLLMSCLLTAAYLLDRNMPFDSPDLSLWVAVLLLQALPYAASLMLSLFSVMPEGLRLSGLDKASPPQPASASRPSPIKTSVP